MKKVLLVFIFSFSIFHFAVAQNPLVKMWDKRYGGVLGDILTSLNQTTNRGYILGGHTASGFGGDKTDSSKGGLDFWIVNIDSMGNKLWDMDYGGTNDDWLICLKPTSDHGFILGGYSYSGISGDKTQDSWGGCDYWILKIDSLGNKLWDKSIGGTGYDYLSSIQQTNDGGYILAGTSNSGISGDKTEDTKGSLDYWIVKLDSAGNQLWDRDFGGIDYDVLTAIVITIDNGYIIGGYSGSNMGGDKSENTWGAADYWIIKIDSVGNIQWDIDFGGSNDDWLVALQENNNGGFVFSGSTYSGISGNKTTPLWSNNFMDYWIIKTDSLGNILWEKDFGGTDTDEGLGNIVYSYDRGYLFSGESYSDLSGNKSENNLGLAQTWIVKTDSNGSILWDKTIFTNGFDRSAFGLETGDGCYIIANISDGNMGAFKTEDSWAGSHDYWIIKFCDTTALPYTLFTASPFLCPGSCITFANLSSNASEYQWSFLGASPDTSSATNPTNICYAIPGTYDVQLIASNANGSDTLLLTNYITVYPSPPVQSIVQSGDTLTAIAGSATYQWYFNGSIITGATNYFFVATQSGDYNVVATDSNGCEVEAAINDVAASIQYTVDSKQFTIFPNPVDEELIIKNEKLRIGSAATISIYNLIGEKVLAVQLPTVPNLRDQLPTCSIDVSGLPPGMYWLDVSAEGKTFRAKFVKQ